MDVRRYTDESDLDDLVAPPEPQPAMPDYMKSYYDEVAKAQADAAKREDAREKASREFRISEGCVRGESPEEEY